MRVSAALTHDGVQKKRVADVERDDLQRGQDPARVREAWKVDPSELIEAHAGCVGMWGAPFEYDSVRAREGPRDMLRRRAG